MQAKKFIHLFIILFLIVSLFVLGSYLFLMPHIKMSSFSNTINVMSDYVPIDYKATFLGKDVTSDVIIDGIVDTSKVGIYPVNYILKEGPLKVNKEIIINVIDKEPPVIELKGDNNYNTCSYDTYIEPGYTAYDNYDGDITDKVEVTNNKKEIIYSVSDSSNNKTVIKREVSEKDIKDPIITLNGNSIIYVPINTPYNELGAKAQDNCSGDLTNKIVIDGTVDSSKIDTYTIKYSAKDNAGNIGTELRKVVVYDPNTTSIPDNDSSIIYLTFDDGPGTYTNQILDILNKYNIKASFFVTNAGSNDLILREYQEGHTIGLHTATHQWNIYSSVDSYFADLKIVSDRVKNITGIDAKYIRFPGGSSNTVSKHYSPGIMSILTNEVQNRGYKYFDWNVAVEDAGACAKKNVKNREACVLNYFEKGLLKNKANIVLLHDIKSYTANSLENMIQYALSNNYKFAQINDDTIECHQKVNN